MTVASATSITPGTVPAGIPLVPLTVAGENLSATDTVQVCNGADTCTADKGCSSGTPVVSFAGGTVSGDRKSLVLAMATNTPSLTAGSYIACVSFATSGIFAAVPGKLLGASATALTPPAIQPPPPLVTFTVIGQNLSANDKVVFCPLSLGASCDFNTGCQASVVARGGTVNGDGTQLAIPPANRTGSFAYGDYLVCISLRSFLSGLLSHMLSLSFFSNS